MKRHHILALILIAFGVVFRLIPHPSNFTPIIAIALFSGAYFNQKKLKFLIPLTTMLISDAIIGFYQGIEITYLAILTSVGIGSLLSLQKFQPFSTILASIASSFLFFIITNFAVWAGSGMYEQTWKGLIECYWMAIPFYQNAIIGDLLFSVIIFGSYHLWSKSVFSQATA